ncbi:MAG: hypothetical protein NUW01_18165 [Gemmatimonadaceae bacterium]|nr:hypothetical protein [Gemmatimonadaceae bacterium]
MPASVEKQLRETREDLDNLRAQFGRLLGDPMIASAYDGSRRIPFDTAFVDPNSSRNRYVLARDGSGFARLVDRTTAKSAWSATTSGFLVPGDLEIDAGNSLKWGDLIATVQNLPTVQNPGGEIPHLLLKANLLAGGGSIFAGGNDAIRGIFYALGPPSGTSGGEVRMYMSGAHDDDAEYWTFFASGANLVLARQDAPVFARFVPDTTNFVDFFDLGEADTRRGSIGLLGGPAGVDNGGEARFYLSDDHDASIEYWSIRAIQDDLGIFTNAGTEVARILGPTAVFQFTNNAHFAAPVTQAFGDVAAVGTAETISRSDHKHGMPADPSPTIPLWVPVIFFSLNGVGGTATFEGNHQVAPIGNATQDGIAYFSVPIPTGFTTLSKAVIVCYPAQTGDLRYSVATSWGADGEARTANTDAIAATTRAVTADEMDAIDVSAALTGIAAGDYVGLAFTRLGSDVLDTITGFRVLGLLLEYT